MVQNAQLDVLEHSSFQGTDFLLSTWGGPRPSLEERVVDILIFSFLLSGHSYYPQQLQMELECWVGGEGDQRVAPSLKVTSGSLGLADVGR